MFLHPQVLLPAHGCYAVQSAHKPLWHPTRNGTGGVIPLAEAITQISFLEFLQRFGILIAPPQSPQSPVSNSLLEAAVQTTTPCKRLSECVYADICSSRHAFVRCGRSDVFLWCPLPYYWMLPAQTNHTAQHFVSACLYADGFSLSFLVFC